jgi:carboxylate-amine ligase
MPYVVEGYHLPDMDFNAVNLLPKGVEIRTPVCRSIQECLAVHETLYQRMQTSLKSDDLIAVALSHHPVESHFSGPQNKRRYDYWQWSMEVMTTYGPDINVGIPAEMMKALDISDLNAKINYYAASMTAFSLAAPFSSGKLWEIRGSIGKSLRTYRRSVIAPPIEIHPNENNRLEFKVFDMSIKSSDYECFFLLFLALLLDSQLKGRASNASRIYDQGAVALHGWNVPSAVERAIELLNAAERTLPAWGFDIEPLAEFSERLRLRRTPADDLIDLYRDLDSNLPLVLKHLSELVPTKLYEHTCSA